MGAFKYISCIQFCFRFKNHMIDLIFMEKIARWLTNTQVKIKAEVANSNSQAQQLAQHLNDLDRRVDACERPNLDKEVNTLWMKNFFFFLIEFHSSLNINTYNVHICRLKNIFIYNNHSCII